jgi:hypothetical protein
MKNEQESFFVAKSLHLVVFFCYFTVNNTLRAIQIQIFDILLPGAHFFFCIFSE